MGGDLLGRGQFRELPRLRRTHRSKILFFSSILCRYTV